MFCDGHVPHDKTGLHSERLPPHPCGTVVEVLERKGLCTKQDLYDIIAEFRRKNPRARIPETVFPEPYQLTETENTIIDDILALLNKHGLTSHQSQNLLERLGRIIERGQRLPMSSTH